jgi:hypothetical protein
MKSTLIQLVMGVALIAMLLSIFRAAILGGRFHRKVMNKEIISNREIIEIVCRVWFFCLLFTISLLFLLSWPSSLGIAFFQLPGGWPIMALCGVLLPLAGVLALGPTIIILFDNRRRDRKE